MQATLKDVKKLTANAPISTVTLLEDRAAVSRILKSNLAAGLWSIRIENVSPLIADKSLRVEFNGNYPNARIDDFRVRRKKIVKESSQPEEIRALKAEARSLYQTLVDLQESLQERQMFRAEIDTILKNDIQEWMVDAIWGQFDLDRAKEHIQTLFRQLRESHAEAIESDRTRTELNQQLQDLNNRIGALSRPDRVYITDLEIDVMIPTEAEYELAIDYTVPNALWRPWHHAQLLFRETPEVLFKCYGCVWQRTGEDWNDVDLVFSTARPSLGSDPPLLTDDLLNVREKAERVVVQARDRRVEKAGLGSGESADSLALPGVDDGGEVRILRSRTKATIPSDGRPYRILLFSGESNAKIAYILKPEMANQVVLKSEQTNTATFPILAGPVDLLRTTEQVGKTAIGFVASGEKFALGWGPDAAIRVQRTHTHKTERHPITRWKIVTHTVRVFISNIGEETRVIETTERVPISELETVKVEVISDRTTEGITADINGFCNWRVTVGPYSQKMVKLTYKVSSSPQVEGI